MEGRGVADLIFGELDGTNLLGAFTLGALGSALVPLKGELKPLPMVIASYFMGITKT